MLLYFILYVTQYCVLKYHIIVCFPDEISLKFINCILHFNYDFLGYCTIPIQSNVSYFYFIDPFFLQVHNYDTTSVSPFWWATSMGPAVKWPSQAAVLCGSLCTGPFGPYHESGMHESLVIKNMTFHSFTLLCIHVTVLFMVLFSSHRIITQ